MTPTAILFWLALAIFAAALQSTLTGFGFALMVMPLAVYLLDIRTAAPLVALVALTLNIINFIRYRQSLDWSEVRRLTLLMMAGIPVGIWALAALDEQIVKRGLGVVLAGYALYAMLRPARLHPISRVWAYPAGFIAGCLGGAYNTPGPPVILYGSLRQWPHHRFRAVLQGAFLLGAVMVVISHALARNITIEVERLYLLSLPALVLGVAVAARLDRRIPADLLRKAVVILILLLGLSLLI
ncbi:MAG: sulfite exporter TauE/SafE family protein [Chloroflexi bacterium]|nr:sulfite exporter TauE/SafE family protein [Chloroflexota bacterium]